MDQMEQACKNGDLKEVRRLIANGFGNWNWGLRSACEGGHLAVANLMIENGADDWDAGLVGACIGGHLAIANLMIKKGADIKILKKKPKMYKRYQIYKILSQVEDDWIIFVMDFI